MAAVFSAKEDIANRALQHCGAPRLLTSDTLASPTSKSSAEIAGCYDQLRVAELTENLWVFATKRAVLRPIDTTTAIFTPPAYSATTTYQPGMVVEGTDGYYWTSAVNDNLANTPGVDGGATWGRYFGPLAVQPYASSTTYFAGELVYVVTGAGTYDVYLSLTTGNADAPATAVAYDSTVTYRKNQVVSYSSTDYQSLVDFNLGNEPDTSATYWTSATTFPTGANSWLKIAGAALSPLVVPYPINAGPASQSDSANVYYLPNGHLRRAPQAPTGGLVPVLGAPSLEWPSDWVYEGPFIISRATTPIVYRFVADVTVVSAFDALFCEGLAARIAKEVCEPLTQATEKLSTITGAYDQAIGKARMIDAIERGPTTPALDPYIACRV